MVSEDDAAALVVVVQQALAVRGYEPRITHENGPRLVRLSRQMLDAFGIGTARDATEENDG